MSSEGILSRIQEMFAMPYLPLLMLGNQTFSLNSDLFFILLFFFTRSWWTSCASTTTCLYSLYGFTGSVENNIARRVVLTRLSTCLAGESRVCQQTGLFIAIHQLPTAGKVGSLALWEWFVCEVLHGVSFCYQLPLVVDLFVWRDRQSSWFPSPHRYLTMIDMVEASKSID